MMEAPVLFEKKEAAAWVTLNRAERMNTLTPELIAALLETLARCEADDEVRVVVLCGKGRAFCAGGDLPTIRGFERVEEAEAYVRGAGKITSAILSSKKPYIAMVGGAAAGAGFNIALACDFICAARGAKFTQAFAAIGLISDCGGSLLLPKLVGLAAAKRLMMLPDVLSAEEAASLGIVTEVADDARLAECVEKLVRRLGVQSPLASAASKRMLNMRLCAELDGALLLEEDAQSQLIVGADCKEGIDAFFAKRAPVFHGKS